MVEKVASGLTQRMMDEKLISDSEKEHYEYALVTIVERLVTLIPIILLSTILKLFVPTILFLIFFFALRERTGGYHAKTFWHCHVFSLLMYVSIILVQPLLAEYQTVLYGLLLAAILLIAYVGTVNHPNMDMDKKELSQSKKWARMLAVILGGCVVLCRMIDIPESYTDFMAIAIIICAMMMMAAKLLKQEVK